MRKQDVTLGDTYVAWPGTAFRTTLSGLPGEGFVVRIVDTDPPQEIRDQSGTREPVWDAEVFECTNFVFESKADLKAFMALHGQSLDPSTPTPPADQKYLFVRQQWTRRLVRASEVRMSHQQWFAELADRSDEHDDT